MGPTIDRDGRFAVRSLYHGVLVRVRGQFLTRDVVAVTYSISRKRRPVCRYRLRITLYWRGLPPFKYCRTHRAPDVVRSDTGRVFFYPGFHGILSDVYFGCLFSANKRFRLFDPTLDDAFRDQVPKPRLAGPFVAFNVLGQASCYVEAAVRVRDLRNGRLVRRAWVWDDVVVRDRPPDAELDCPVTVLSDLELRDDGAVAWIAADLDPTPVFIPTVVAVDGQGKRRLNAGDGIEPESLTLNGSTLSWINGGVLKIAELR